MDFINLSINRLKIYAFHGVLPQERKVGANFYLTIKARVEVDDSALKEDCLKGTVSYADVIKVATEEMKVASQLLENVAFRIANKLLSDFNRIQEVNVYIEKENPPLKAQTEGVGINLTLFR